jgi:hypothetical protein
MKRAALVVVIAGAIGAVIGLGYPVLFPSEERRIRKQLDELVEMVNSPPADGMAALARTAKIGNAFTTDVRIDFGDAPPVQGREAIMGIASRLQDRIRTVNVALQDVDVAVNSERTSADIDLTVVVKSDDDTDAREFQVQMVKPDDRWLIAGAVAVKVLQK